jgi:hypothetical protein
MTYDTRATRLKADKRHPEPPAVGYDGCQESHMRFALWMLFLLAGLAAHASADDIAGSWKVIFVRGAAWQSIGDADFDFKVEGNKLSGTAHIGVGWPGTAPISEGVRIAGSTIEGDRVSFLVLGQQPSSDGYPKMRFEGTVRGDQLQLTMTLFYSDTESVAGRLGKSEFKGQRITN